MAVVALVCDASEARTVITWSARFALAQKAELIIYYLTDVSYFRQTKVSIDGEERFADPTREAIQQAIESVVRTRKARKGRIGRYEVTVRHVTDPDPVKTMIHRIRVEAPQLFVGMCETDEEINKLAISRQVATRIACDSVVLYGDESRSTNANDIIVGATGGRHDREALSLSVAATATVKGSVTAISIDSDGNADEADKAHKALAKSLEELQLSESDTLHVKSMCTADRAAALAEASQNHDLILVGPDVEKVVSQLLESTQQPLVGIFRRAPRLAAEHGWVHTLARLPRINPADYADLYEKLQSGSRWNTDFVAMLSLATAIATLGLLQSSPAVVIGSMLLAPLMTPMIGMGLALNRGNAKLAYASFRAIGRGFLATLMISAFIGYVTPGSDLTPEIMARTEPNILDLLIALFSGAAAAYAMARPSLAGSIAGVAIATALVPPLCSAGVSLSYGKDYEAIGAAWLLAVNVLAIILAAAITFRAMGLSDSSAIVPQRMWVRRVFVGLSICCVVIGLPLFITFWDQVHRGEPAPIALTVTNETRLAILNKIDTKPGVELLLIGRPGIPREQDPIDVGIVISSDRPLPRSYADELSEIVRAKMQDSELNVRVECVANGWE